MLTATEYALAPFAAVGLVTIVSKLHDTFRFFLSEREPVATNHGVESDSSNFIYSYSPPPGCQAVWVDGKKVWENGEVTSEALRSAKDVAQDVRESGEDRPSCYGRYLAGQAEAERGCRMCRHMDDCYLEKMLRRVVLDQMEGRPLDPIAEVQARMKAHRLFTAEHLDDKVADPLWMKKDCYVTEQDSMLQQHVPNVGGEGNPDYAGPNYVADEDLADEMKGIWHFGTLPKGEEE